MKIFKNSKIYDILKLIGRLVLPISTFVAAVFQIWGLPYGDKITATLAALVALINGILALDSVNFWNEHQIVEVPETVEVEEDPDDEYDP